MSRKGYDQFGDDALDQLIREAMPDSPPAPEGHLLHTLAAFRQRNSRRSMRSPLVAAIGLFALAASVSLLVLGYHLRGEPEAKIPDQALSVMFEFDDEETDLFQEWHELGDSVLASNAQSVRGVSD